MVAVLCVLVVILSNLLVAITGVAAVPHAGGVEVCTASGMVVFDVSDGAAKAERPVCASCPPLNHVGGAAFVAPVEPPLFFADPERTLRPVASRAAFGLPDVRSTARAPPA